MMRPNTLAEAIGRILDGTPREIALGELLDHFYTRPTAVARAAVLADPPAPTGDARLDALAGAIGEYLTRQYDLGPIPSWTADPRRFLDLPWFTAEAPTDALREYLTFVSPAEFKSRNIMTEARPLSRATTPR